MRQSVSPEFLLIQSRSRPLNHPTTSKRSRYHRPLSDHHMDSPMKIGSSSHEARATKVSSSWLWDTSSSRLTTTKLRFRTTSDQCFKTQWGVTTLVLVH